jgi:hypothetical protein
VLKRIAIINKSTVVSNDDVNKMTFACNLQLSRDVAPIWGRVSIPVTFYTSESLVPAGSAKIFIFDNTDHRSFLGYHSVKDGVVIGKVFAKTIMDYGLQTLTSNTITVSTVLSHEVIELFCNPYVSLWSDGTPILEGSQYAVETCNAVQTDFYKVSIELTPKGPTTIVNVSNFLYPEYFNISSPVGTKLDQMGLLKTPFTITKNGYMIVRNAPGTEISIFGSNYPEILKNL